MYQIFVGSVILSAIHACIPNHWLPLIAVGKSEKWTQRQTLQATLITGIAHTLSTILIGILVGLIGFKLSASYSVISETIAPAILIGLGVIYIIVGFRHHNHHHELNPLINEPVQKKSRWLAVITSLSLAMFLTPCIEIEAYYFQAGTMGWPGIFMVSDVYVTTTVLAMLLLVFLGMKGVNAFRSGFLECHEKQVTGAVLVLLGILALLARF
jgi:nickel/cobalt transporter (NicO) family protein